MNPRSLKRSNNNVVEEEYENKIFENSHIEFNVIFEQEDKFQSLYYRNNRSFGQKNIRCFPTCCEEEHNENHFCGQPLKISFTMLVKKNKNGEYDRNGSMDYIRLVAEFKECNAEYALKKTVSVQELQILAKSKTNPTNPFFLGKIINTEEPLETTRGILHRSTVEFNSECQGWNYSWIGSRFKSSIKHVISITIMLPEILYPNKIIKLTDFDNPIKDNTTINSPIISFRPIGYFDSPSFLISSLSGKGGSTIAKGPVNLVKYELKSYLNSSNMDCINQDRIKCSEFISNLIDPMLISKESSILSVNNKKNEDNQNYMEIVSKNEINNNALSNSEAIWANIVLQQVAEDNTGVVSLFSIVADYVGSGEYEKKLAKNESIEKKKGDINLVQSNYEYEKEIYVKSGSNYSNNHILTVGKILNKNNDNKRCDKCNEIKLNHICRVEIEKRDKDRVLDVDNITSLILKSSSDIVKKNKKLERKSISKISLENNKNNELNLSEIELLMNLPDNSDNSYSLRAYPNIKQPNNIDYELSEKSRIWLLPKVGTIVWATDIISYIKNDSGDLYTGEILSYDSNFENVKILFSKTGKFSNMSDKESRTIIIPCDLVEGVVDITDKRKQKKRNSDNFVTKIKTTRVNLKESRLEAKKILKKKHKLEAILLEEKEKEKNDQNKINQPIINQIPIAIVADKSPTAIIKTLKKDAKKLRRDKKQRLEAIEINRKLDLMKQKEKDEQNEINDPHGLITSLSSHMPVIEKPNMINNYISISSNPIESFIDSNSSASSNESNINDKSS